MTEPGLPQDGSAEHTAQSPVAGPKPDPAIDEALTNLRSGIAGVKQVQQDAMRATGEATSNDRSVSVVVDATGVLTSLRIDPSAFENTTPERLAQTVVAAIQSAAAQARGRMSAAMAPAGTADPAVADTVAKGLASLGIQRMSVPDVPRTAADPTTEQGAEGGWTPPESRPSRPEWGAIAADPADEPAPQPQFQPPTPAPSRRPRHQRVEDDAEDWTNDERPW